MSIALLNYSPSSQNHRVVGYEVPGDEQPRIYSNQVVLSAIDLDALIQAAYRQIYNEQQMLASHRQLILESQLKSKQITVKEFIRGLATSDSFRRLNFESNNNYRFVQMCLQRILGRNAYSDREAMAWSIVLATKGLPAFIDALLNSDEYIDNFGDDTVPYQRRRILPQRAQGELPFARMARYGADYRDKLPRPTMQQQFGRDYHWSWQRQTPTAVKQLGGAIAYTGGFLLVLGTAAVFLSAVGLISL
ncbi:MAG TPA: phycobilisome rod-core linker polypeptide [Stenomitos sp.]